MSLHRLHYRLISTAQESGYSSGGSAKITECFELDRTSRGHLDILQFKTNPNLKLHQIAQYHDQGSCKSPTVEVTKPFWWATPGTVWPKKIVPHHLIKMSLDKTWICSPSYFCIPLKKASSFLQPLQLKSPQITHAAELRGRTAEAQRAISATLL